MNPTQELILAVTEIQATIIKGSENEALTVALVKAIGALSKRIDGLEKEVQGKEPRRLVY